MILEVITYPEHFPTTVALQTLQPGRLEGLLAVTETPLQYRLAFYLADNTDTLVLQRWVAGRHSYHTCEVTGLLIEKLDVVKTWDWSSSGLSQPVVPIEAVEMVQKRLADIASRLKVLQ